ncbi:hypothetical protein AVEN_248353-1 [Araneus ventricosus]|uniref:Uncharacterized protein n=1 Tax=Araneus ventricosus TaxID=182803 RepID=A0A4Y2MP72_ARAVE|nr:hypothetical protein AVEN_248353-1 [Araneus ventricosus]
MVFALGLLESHCILNENSAWGDCLISIPSFMCECDDSKSLHATCVNIGIGFLHDEMRLVLSVGIMAIEGLTAAKCKFDSFHFPQKPRSNRNAVEINEKFE